MKAFWEGIRPVGLRITRAVSFCAALALLLAAAYLAGQYSPAAKWISVAMFAATGAGCLCNCGIASQKIFRSGKPHLVKAAACLAAALCIVLLV